MPNNRQLSFVLFLLIYCLPTWSVFAVETNSYAHVIITSEAFKNDTSAYALSELKAHRIAQGMPSIIVSTDSIYAQYDGVDRPEQIRNFIKDAKNKWNTKYVLIGGDVNIVPVRMLYARSVNMASDMYYACLDNSFNDDGDNLWGEVNDGLDFEYDVYVGRASAQNSDEMHNFVYKTLCYENSPLNASYHTKMIHMSQEASGIGNTEKWCDRYREKSDEITFEYYRVTDAQADPICNNRLSHGNVGYYLGASHGYVTKLANITQAEALRFANADQFYFMTSIACLSGKFDQDCVAESLCTSTRTGGAFAGMFNSESAYPPYIVQYIYKLRDLHFVNKITKLGELRAKVAATYNYSDYLKTDATAMARRYQAYQYNLFGDPATDLKTAISSPIDVDLCCDAVLDAKVEDMSGNDNKATVHGNVDTTTLLDFKALRFDGADSYLTVPHNAWNPMGNQLELTLSTWLYIDSLTSRTALFVKGNDKNPFALYLTQSGHLLFELNTNLPANAWKNLTWTSDTQLKQKGLYHLAVVVEYKTLQAHIYIDGDLRESKSIPAFYLMGSTLEPLYIAKDPKANACLMGAMADVKVYSKSLSAAEVRQVMAHEKPFSIAHTSIINAETSQALSAYSQDEMAYSIQRSELNGQSIAMQVELEENENFEGSIVYTMDGLTMLDNEPDFSSFVVDGELNMQLNRAGEHSLCVMLFSEKDGKGYILDERNISVSIVENTGLLNTSLASQTISINSNAIKDCIVVQNAGTYQDAQLVLFNASGQLIVRKDVLLNEQYSLDVSSLKDGVYFLSIRTAEQSCSFKILKN